jgi:hypothetical protein
MNDRLHIHGGLDLVQLSLQFFIVDAVEILSPVCNFNVLLSFLGRVVDLSK